MKENCRNRRWLIQWGICFLLPFAPNGSAQQPEPVPTALNIVVVEGEGTVSQVRQRVTPEPRIRVENEAHRPITGAAVVFTLPTEGATGEFGNGSKTLVVNTDNAGQAVAQGLRMNEIAGKTSIHVTASYKGLSARSIISLESVLPPGATQASVRKHGHGVLIAVLVIVGGAAAGGAVYATQHGGSSSAPPSTINSGPTPIGITVGTGTITGGH